MSQTVREPPARIGIKSPEEGLDAIENADDKSSRAKRFEILWGKAEPEPLAKSRKHQRDK
jgi:hypothetical protein